MDTVFVANVFAEDGGMFVGVYTTPEKAMEALRDKTHSTLEFREYTIKTSGRKFWSAMQGMDDYSVREEWVQ